MWFKKTTPKAVPKIAAGEIWLMPTGDWPARLAPFKIAEVSPSGNYVRFEAGYGWHAVRHQNWVEKLS
jgi:hypothetical protein